MRRLLRRVLRRARDVVVGTPEVAIMDRLAIPDLRWESFVSAIEYATARVFVEASSSEVVSPSPAVPTGRSVLHSR
jgi:hypothetical protein